MEREPFLARFARASDEPPAQDPESKEKLARLSTIMTKVARETSDDR